MTQDIERGKVFSVDNETDSIVAAIQSDDITRSYECTLDSCDNPVCACGTVHITFSPLEHEDQDNLASPYKVDIDVVRKELAYKDTKKVPRKTLNFAKLLLSSMDDADFQLLWKFYFTYKNEKTEKASIDSIEAIFDFQQVEYDGLMYAYNDVLPYGEPLIVNIKGKNCSIFDQYCLLPKCPCTDTTLTFFSEEASDNKDEELFSVELNYMKKQWEPVEEHALSVDVESVRSAIEEQIPDIYKQLLKRHKKLKGIYAHCKRKHFSQQPQLPKVGRNDPCPCGSGKKYKKCCLGK